MDLLRAAAAHAGFALWAPASAEQQQHELLPRDRFYREPRSPRVVWLRAARTDITWFNVFKLQADRSVEGELGCLEFAGRVGYRSAAASRHPWPR